MNDKKLSKKDIKFLEKELFFDNVEYNVKNNRHIALKDIIERAQYCFMNDKELMDFIEIYTKELTKNKIAYHSITIKFTWSLFDGYSISHKIITKNGRVLFRINYVGLEYLVFRNEVDNKSYAWLFYFYGEYDENNKLKHNDLFDKVANIGLELNDKK